LTALKIHLPHVGTKNKNAVTRNQGENRTDVSGVTENFHAVDAAHWTRDGGGGKTVKGETSQLKPGSGAFLLGRNANMELGGMHVRKTPEEGRHRDVGYSLDKWPQKQNGLRGNTNNGVLRTLYKVQSKHETITTKSGASQPQVWLTEGGG